ncbi:hypothetical protein J2S71_000137 [Olsenella profusa DSM 13989]|uniref:hypothetical protein n=1 Tax=Olsenella profusa TaxID=138595 RepID=UPI0027874831|nr:hypothetical protein [Olsenella profusa]MDP9858441.1 hypothetical protein [Olsenella profusa DSM 13989]
MSAQYDGTRSLRTECERREDAVRAAVASRDELNDLFAASVRYGDSQVVEALRWSMSQALSACDDHVDEMRRQLRRSEDVLGEALARSRREVPEGDGPSPM